MASKRNRIAPVWSYMEQSSSDAVTVTCLVCKDALKFCGGTSSMLKHLHTRHPIEYAELKEDSECDVPEKLARPSTSAQPTLMETMTRAHSYRNDSGKKKELDELVVSRRIVEKTCNHYLLWKTKGSGI
ncbi:hypothetical protein E2C01_000199 [Portunus trituberculatus]|uniref:BED-type domain-containing protein n=1 Tax=Portunus trituberculatus TaxID=210409 RepID=A0A5B7CEA8_PORTR|nr:hypothetical protein [Portunus trituberculatus]